MHFSWPVEQLPEPFFLDRAEEAHALIDGWLAGESCDKEVKAALKPKDSAARSLFASLAGNSPFLLQTLRREAEFAQRLSCTDPSDLFEEQMRGLRAVAPLTNQSELMRLLRVAKAHVALLVAAADVAGIWTLERVTAALSEFAEIALDLAVSHVLFGAMSRGDLAWPDEPLEHAQPGLGATSGYTVLAMGKLGGRELNYSSDIDLIVLFDEEAIQYTGTKSPSDLFVKLTQDLVRIIEQRTMYGYVFRTDLRLRPDAGATPVALSMGAAEVYYSSQGLNWERSAMIKARPVAGDTNAGNAFLSRLKGFVWRSHLDFAAMQDIHAIKQQIHRHHHHGEMTLEGYDVKLGRGGIREIEFFAQIHQLIAGGRDPGLRQMSTRDALDAICMSGRISETDRSTLYDAYQFLRTLEHRLQMIADEQTHTLPDTAEALDHVAVFCGLKDRAALEKVLFAHARHVIALYDSLLPAGEQEEPTRLDLSDYGFQDLASATEIVERWRRGRHRALRTERARRLLEECLPHLLKAFQETDDTDRALARFDRFVGKLPAGVQLFSLFKSNPSLFRLIAHIMGIAPALADRLARNTSLLDAVLDPGFFEPLPARKAIQADAEAFLERATDYQDALDLARRWTHDHAFQTGVQLLEGLIPVSEAGRALSDVADSILSVLLPIVEGEFSRRYGRFPGGSLAILALGKHGGRELSYTSDLDLIMLYDVDGAAVASDGPKPLAPSQYFSRLGQNLVTAITALTGEGRLYEVDMRLRPSGSSGPLVVTLKTFEEYQSAQAWTWEHMALTRARILLAPPAFAEQIKNVIKSVLTAKREPLELAFHIHEMRRKLEKEFTRDNIWSLKHVRGGMVDVEFIVQHLLLRDGNAHPETLTPNVPETVGRLAGIGAMDGPTALRLIEAYTLYSTVQGILRLCVETDPDESRFSNGLIATLLRSTGSPNLEDLRAKLAGHQAFVLETYQALVERPASQHKDQT